MNNADQRYPSPGAPKTRTGILRHSKIQTTLDLYTQEDSDETPAAQGEFLSLRWIDGSYLLFVEPRLIGNLDVVSVRVADVCREVVGTPFGPKARFLV